MMFRINFHKKIKDRLFKNHAYLTLDTITSTKLTYSALY